MMAHHFFFLDQFLNEGVSKVDNINKEAGERSPKITCDWEKGTMEVIGESYPENVTEFYGPVLSAMENHLNSNKDKKFLCAFELLYFNSSSAKVLMSLSSSSAIFSSEVSSLTSSSEFWSVSGMLLLSKFSSWISDSLAIS